MKSILVVDDDKFMCERLRVLLERFKFQVEIVHTFEGGYKAASEKGYSLFLVDLCLGTDHGILLIKQLRAMKIIAPILAWSQHDPQQFAPCALDAGADAFIEKRLDPNCLVSWINAHLRSMEWRHGWKPSSQRRIILGRAILDRETRTLEIDGELVKLTQKETSILDLLGSDPKRVFRPREVLREIWGPSSVQTEEAVHAVVRRLRKKLEGNQALRDLVANRYGKGFQLCASSPLQLSVPSGEMR